MPGTSASLAETHIDCITKVNIYVNGPESSNLLLQQKTPLVYSYIGQLHGVLLHGVVQCCRTVYPHYQGVHYFNMNTINTSHC